MLILCHNIFKNFFTPKIVRDILRVKVDRNFGALCMYVTILYVLSAAVFTREDPRDGVNDLTLLPRSVVDLLYNLCAAVGNISSNIARRAARLQQQSFLFIHVFTV